MAIEIEHVPQRSETVHEIVAEPEDDDEVISTAEQRGRTLYKVKREVTIREERYIVRTVDAMGKESRTYFVEQNEDGEWRVTKLRKNANRGYLKKMARNPKSTETVREALKDRHGIELVN